MDRLPRPTVYEVRFSDLKPGQVFFRPGEAQAMLKTEQLGSVNCVDLFTGKFHIAPEMVGIYAYDY